MKFLLKSFWVEGLFSKSPSRGAGRALRYKNAGRGPANKGCGFYRDCGRRVHRPYGGGGFKGWRNLLGVTKRCSKHLHFFEDCAQKGAKCIDILFQKRYNNVTILLKIGILFSFKEEPLCKAKNCFRFARQSCSSAPALWVCLHSAPMQPNPLL